MLPVLCFTLKNIVVPRMFIYVQNNAIQQKLQNIYPPVSREGVTSRANLLKYCKFGIFKYNRDGFEKQLEPFYKQ